MENFVIITESSKASTTKTGSLSSFSCYGKESVDVAAPGLSVAMLALAVGIKIESTMWVNDIGIVSVNKFNKCEIFFSYM